MRFTTHLESNNFGTNRAERMTSRFLGVLNKSIDLSNLPLKKNINCNSVGPLKWWITSDFSLNTLDTKDFLVLADWNIYGTVVRNLDDFINIYQIKGIGAAFAAIKGEFALALYNKKEKVLYLGRDNIGYKPLYYIQEGRSIGFASYSTWLSDFKKHDKGLNHQSVALFAGGHYRYIDNDPKASFFKDIKQVPAASYVCLTQESEAVKSYQSLKFDIFENRSFEDIVHEYKDLFLKGVQERLELTKGSKCFLLSGGMDSSSVLAAAVNFENSKQIAFSTIYEDKTYDESEDIQTILDDCVSSWIPCSIKNIDFFALVEKMVADNDGPVATATWLSHYLLYEEIASRGFTDVYGGLGGDEANAGEFEHFFYFFADLKYAGSDITLRHEVDKWVEHHDHPIFKKDYALAQESWQRLTDQKKPGMLKFDIKKYSRYYEAINRDFFDLSNFKPQFPHFSKSYLNNKTLSDTYYETIPCCLRANDRHDATFGLRTHFPFFDFEFFSFAHRIPPQFKTRDGITKVILREAMKGILPESTRTRIKKTGWNAPFHLWMMEGKNKTNLLDLLNSQKFRQRGIYNMSVVNRLLSEHDHIISSGLNQENHMMFFWQLINLELWLSKGEEK